ncbi:S-layer homology domain-containing protein [Colidextribacter sp. OB.20]|nr:S-layer homology domain-containing protein [Colidextribacter sp. OB.20]
MLLAAVLMLGMVPGLTLPASAEHWADGYLDQLVEWGVMRADQTSDPDAPLTRAEFMAVINRAYGYNKTGPIPFEDVNRGDWFYDDVSIAYTAGYTLGTSATTFHPNATLNREQAVCILARNMMMKETPGENLAFSDARNISDWARGLVKTAVDHYIVNGYPDGSFGPQDVISKGQMASMLVGCLGTPLNQAGEYALGDVYGNVTITASGVTLRNTTVSGDLYVSAGVGLGNVRLENVNVLGRIIVSGTGESQGGDASVVLRNVTANEMLVDNMKDQLVTLRADGLTSIGVTTVKTPAYLEDNTPDGLGLRQIIMENAGGRLTLAGRVKEVINKAPGSTIQLSKGTVGKLTVDEAAVGSTVQLDRNTEAKEINLDTGASVNGQGDVDKMNVNASDVTSTMLPNDIYIRPGLESNIAGEIMDSAAAEESSLDPQILSGYPQANDIAPTSLRADFAGNKRGTVYWAVSNITDGSITADDLISPPSYGSLAMKSGSVALPSAETVVPVSITGLTSGGSYYLSAVLVDAREQRSPVKVISFTTPDNTKPAFAQGYPYISLVTDTLAQATVMATKSCKLYYAVLPQNASAPTINDLKSAAVTGNLGYGVMDVVKNTEHTFTISRQLEELKDYTAYFWLTDANGANSSSIVAVRFTTKDMTPPEFNPDPDPNTATEGATSVTLTAGLNEKGTIFWAVVPRGKAYPNPNPGNSEDNENGAAKLDTLWAKIQVEYGRGATKRGQVKVNDPNTEVTLNITGLAKETVYDLYYVAKDDAGNYSKWVKKITIKTEDSTGPVVYQYFSDFQGNDPTEKPTVSSDVILDFSESIAIGDSGDLLDLYKSDPEHTKATDFLRENFILRRYENMDWPVVDEKTKEADKEKTRNWVDYSKVIVRASETREGHVEVVFSPDQGALKMTSGTQFQFELRNVKDLSGNPPKGPIPILTPKNCEKTEHTLKIFDTVFAWVELGPGTDRPSGKGEAPDWIENPKAQPHNNGGKQEDGSARVDGYFIMRPKSTANAAADLRYDIIIMGTGDYISYDLYYRIKTPSGVVNTEASIAEGYGLSAAHVETEVDDGGWVYLGNKESNMTRDKVWDSMSLGREFNKQGEQPFFLPLTSLREGYMYEFAISVTKKAENTDPGQWRGSVGFRAYVVAGYSTALAPLAQGGASGKLQPKDIDDFNKGIGSETGRSIGTYQTQDYVDFLADLGGRQLPGFKIGPNIELSDENPDKSVEINFALENPATVYYVVANRDDRTNDGWGGRLDTELTLNTKTTGTPPTTELDVTKSEQERLKEIVDELGMEEEDLLGTITSTISGQEKLLWEVITLQTNRTSMIPGKLFYTVGETPAASNIVNGKGLEGKYRYGTMVYEGGNTTPTFTIGNTSGEGPDTYLTPDTEYYIYMVITDAAGNRSPVYIYNFATEPTKPPKIVLTHNAKNEGIADITTKETDSDLIYTMITISTANERWKGVLNQKMHEVSDGKVLPEPYGKWTEVTEKDENNQDVTVYKMTDSITVWEALKTRFSYKSAYNPANITGDKLEAIREGAYFPPDGARSDDYSVFDIYAGDDVRRQVYDMIHDAGSPYETSSKKDIKQELNKDNPAEKDPHVIFVMGRSTSTDDQVDNYSFAAINLDIYGEPPALIEEGTSCTINTDDNGATFSGTFSLHFDGDLYYVERALEEGEYASELHQNCGGNCGKNCKDVIDLYSPQNSGIVLTSTGVHTSLTDMLEFRYSNLRPGDQITITSPGNFSNRYGRTSQSKVYIKVEQEGEDYYIRVLWGSKVIAEQKCRISKPVNPAPKPTRIVPGTFAQNTPGSDEYNGTFTIRFDKPLYWADVYTSNNVLPVYNNKTAAAGGISITDYVGKNGGTVEATGTGSSPATSFSLSVKDVKAGTVFSWFSQGFISSEDAEKTLEKMTVTVRVEDEVTNALTWKHVYLDLALGDNVVDTQEVMKYSVSTRKP